tara:strand:+ start:12097 stop:13254 length:1158 start_codon:yes stop_codon:yes gene_type:complete
MKTLKKYLYLYKTLILQIVSMLLAVLAFLILSSKDTSFTIKLEVVLAWLGIFSMIAGFGSNSIFTQQIKILIRRKELATLFVLRAIVSIFSTFGFCIVAQSYYSIELSILQIISFYLFFLVDFTVIHLAFSAINAVLFINIIRWLAILIIIYFSVLKVHFIINTYIFLTIFFNLYFGRKYVRFILTPPTSFKLIKQNLLNIFKFNITNFLNITFTRLDIIVAARLLPENLVLIYMFSKRLTNAMLSLSLVRSLLILGMNSQEKISNEILLINRLVILGSPFLMIALAIYWFSILGQSDLIVLTVAWLSTLLVVYLSSRKSIILNSEVHKNLKFSRDLVFTIFAFTCSIPIPFITYFFNVMLVFFFVRVIYEGCYIITVKKWQKEI